MWCHLFIGLVFRLNVRLQFYGVPLISYIYQLCPKYHFILEWKKPLIFKQKNHILKTLYIRNSLQEHSSSSQEEEKMFQQPSFLQYAKEQIQFTATIHRILQCFLETPRFTAAVSGGRQGLPGKADS